MKPATRILLSIARFSRTYSVQQRKELAHYLRSARANPCKRVAPRWSAHLGRHIHWIWN